jgi:hypothetical protein
MSKRLSVRGEGSPAPAEEPRETAAHVDLELDLRARLSIDPNALDAEFLACPADTAHLGWKLAEAIKAHLKAKKAARKARALVSVVKRAEMTVNGKAPTVDAVRDAVELAPEVDAADAAEIEAEAARERAKTDFEAVRAKRDMLVQLGAARRAEWESDPVVRAQRRERWAKDGG